jgi:hypothetical protein
MPSAMSLGSGRRIDPQLSVAIRGPREEEFGARLSDTPYMYSTDLVGNTGPDMSAMQFCRVMWKKEMASLEGRAKPLGGSGRSPKEGTQRVAREEEKHPRCDVLDIWAICLFANQATDMSAMRFLHAAENKH